MPIMTKIERMNAALKGEAVDRVPISFWRHFYHQERDPGLLADALLAFQREYEWDFMKVNPRASYHVEGWGNQYSYTDDPNVSPRLVSHVVHTRDDWARIDVLDIWATEPLRQQLVLLELIREGLQDENLYFLHTIFSPLSIAFRLAGRSNERLSRAMKDEAQQLEGALEAITETFVNYARASIDAGASGLFFAVTSLASRDVMTEEQYERFGTPYDLRVLTAVRDRPGFNMLHLCGDNIFFDRLIGYPVDAFNWDASLAGNPSLKEVKERSGKMVVGGLNQRETLAQGTPEEVAREVESGIRETGGRGYAISPGCTFPTTAKRELLRAAPAARDRYSGEGDRGQGSKTKSPGS